MERGHNGAEGRHCASLLTIGRRVLAESCDDGVAVIDPYCGIIRAGRPAVEVPFVEIGEGFNDGDFGIRLIARGNIDHGLAVLRRKEDRIIESFL